MRIGPILMSRRIVQIGFALFLLFIGWQFVNFVTYLETGGIEGSSYRPPAVEGFLPVSALVGFRYLLYAGEFDIVHPAGLSIFITILLVSFLLRRSFCSWLCPFGSLSEALALVGNKIFGRNFIPPKWLDYILRSIKYILLAFFIGSLFILMPGFGVASFMVTPYNIMADIKMLEFFRNISTGGLLFFGILGVLSLLIRDFWCRYLCPYGALLGLLGWFSPTVIQRDESKCINCGLCNQACSAHLDIENNKVIRSPECDTCLDCINKCPAQGALKVKIFNWYKGLLPYRFSLIVLGLFIGITLLFKFIGHWETAVTLEQYSQLMKIVEQI